MFCFQIINDILTFTFDKKQFVYFKSGNTDSILPKKKYTTLFSFIVFLHFDNVLYCNPGSYSRML